MCPAEERILRIEQNDASIFEQEHPSRPDWTSEMMMVKALLKRSSQATELNKPPLRQELQKPYYELKLLKAT